MIDREITDYYNILRKFFKKSETSKKPLKILYFLFTIGKKGLYIINNG